MARSIIRLIVLAGALWAVDTGVLSHPSAEGGDGCMCYTESVECRAAGIRRCAHETGEEGSCYVCVGRRYHIEACTHMGTGDNCGRSEHFHWNERCNYRC